MKLFENYLKQIDSAITPQFGVRSTVLNSLNEGKNYFQKGFSYTDAVAPETGLEKLAKLLGLQLNTPSFGNHPDFAAIKDTGVFERHYATSVFQDIKGSTSLFKKFTDEQIYVIIQTIIVATSHTHGLFQGHVQRLQYDGVFSYFVRKEMKKEIAAFYSLCATAFSTYFVRYELKEYFVDRGLDKINVRTGIDFGDADKVMWVAYGLNGCSEVSTNSLHTSLAFKIQSMAYADKICVGENMVKLLPTLSKYFTPHVKSDKSVDDIIWSDDRGYNYRHYDFNWESFLLDQYSDFVKRENGKLVIEYNAIPSEISRIAQVRNYSILSKIGAGNLDSTGKFTTTPTPTPISTKGKYGWED